MKKKGVGRSSVLSAPTGMVISAPTISQINQLDSVFRVLEPVVGKINEKAKAPVFLSSRFGLRQPRSEWFRIYRVRISPPTAGQDH
jgi:hypothetical protein